MAIPRRSSSPALASSFIVFIPIFPVLQQSEETYGSFAFTLLHGIYTHEGEPDRRALLHAKRIHRWLDDRRWVERMSAHVDECQLSIPKRPIRAGVISDDLEETIRDCYDTYSGGSGHVDVRILSWADFNGDFLLMVGGSCRAAQPDFSSVPDVIYWPEEDLGTAQQQDRQWRAESVVNIRQSRRWQSFVRRKQVDTPELRSDPLSRATTEDSARSGRFSNVLADSSAEGVGRIERSLCMR